MDPTSLDQQQSSFQRRSPKPATEILENEDHDLNDRVDNDQSERGVQVEQRAETEMKSSLSQLSGFLNPQEREY